MPSFPQNEFICSIRSFSSQSFYLAVYMVIISRIHNSRSKTSKQQISFQKTKINVNITFSSLLLKKIPRNSRVFEYQLTKCILTIEIENYFLWKHTVYHNSTGNLFRGRDHFICIIYKLLSMLLVFRRIY